MRHDLNETWLSKPPLTPDIPWQFLDELGGSLETAHAPTDRSLAQRYVGGVLIVLFPEACGSSVALVSHTQQGIRSLCSQGV